MTFNFMLSTKAISVSKPTKTELTCTRSLMACLSWYGVMDNFTDYEHRKNIIKRLESLFKEWLVEMCESMNLPKVVTDNVGGKVVPFGSFNLGVDSKDSDMDLLCVGPWFLVRRDFFTSFFEKLNAQEEIKNIQVTEEALKMTYDGIEIDLLFARLSRNSVPENMNLLDDQLLNEMDTQCVMSLDGYRVSEETLKSVPDEDRFRLALRAVRFWAKCRNIYSFKSGFLGGVSWAILMARVCQLYPTATASILLIRFFSLMTEWINEPSPVLLRTGVGGYFRGIQFWDPHTKPSDVLSIISPAYPQMNTSISVTPSTIGILKEEFERGHAITKNVSLLNISWGKLFETSNILEGNPKATAETELVKPQAPKRKRPAPSGNTSSKTPRLCEEVGPGIKSPAGPALHISVPYR